VSACFERRKNNIQDMNSNREEKKPEAQGEQPGKERPLPNETVYVLNSRASLGE